MAAQQQPVPQPPPPAPPSPTDAVLSQNVGAISNAIGVCAGKAAGSQSAAEAKDFMAAVLAGAQAVITLDSARLAGGATPQAQAASSPPRLPPTKDGNRNGIIGG